MVLQEPLMIEVDRAMHSIDIPIETMQLEYGPGMNGWGLTLVNRTVKKKLFN